MSHMNHALPFLEREQELCTLTRFYQTRPQVDHDSLLELLYTRVRQKYPGEIVLIRQVQAEAEPVVRL